MNYGSVCSGIEAATVAWHPLGWKAIWYSEIEPFPSRLLKHHYPQVPNLGDMTRLRTNEIFINEPIDLLVGGTPCQSFSVAGLRGGLSDDRGNLALEFCRILVAKQPRWFVWENVPGALSSYSDETQQGDEETSDFAAILTAFSECGYSCAWRVLDAQYFGVPQRRRRIFVVGYLGNDWRPPATVLFEPESVPRDITPGRKAGKEIAGTLDARTKGGGFPGSDGAMNGHVVACFDASYGKLQGASGQDLNHGHSHLIPIAFQPKQTASGAMPYGPVTPTLDKSKVPGILYKLRVRRITPLEAERLQGFPDNYTLIPGASDTARYQAIGNSMAVPVMRWIGKRIDTVDKFLNSYNK